MIGLECPRIAPNGNRLPERLPVGHRLVDTTKQQWLIGPAIGSGGFGEIYLTRQYNENTDSRLTQSQIVAQSARWANVIKFEHFSGPLFAEINFYLRVAKKETIDEYILAKNLKHLGMPRYVASGIYDTSKADNPLPVCKNIMNATQVIQNDDTQIINNKKRKLNGKSKALASGSKKQKAPVKEKKYRFLVLQRFGDDVQKILTQAGSRFDMKAAFAVALKVIDTLEYIHSHGYVHADVKASNLLLGLKDDISKSASTDDSQQKNGKITNFNHNNLDTSSSKLPNSISSPAPKRRTPARASALSAASKTKTPASTTKIASAPQCIIEPTDEVYLIDFGLVEKYTHKDGRHRDYVEDQRRANNGTVEFSSRDAHIGAFSRRSDLESLAYNLLFWVSGGRLPWTNVLKDHHQVEISKKWYMDHLEEFVNYCFNEHADPIDAAKLLAEDDSATKVSTGGGGGGARNGAGNGNITSSRQSSTQDSIMCAALYDFVSYIAKLGYADEPDYYLLKTILNNALVGTGMNGFTSGRTARKRRSDSLKRSRPKIITKCENPTPAMLEILRKMQLKKH